MILFLAVPVGAAGVTKISAGDRCNFALESDGTVWNWGVYGFYPLVIASTPVQVPGLSGVTAVDAGSGTANVLESDGTVWTTSNGYSGQITRLSGIIAISGTTDHSALAIRNDGTVWAWGNGYGYHYDPFQVPGLTGVVAVAASEDFSVALKNDGTVWTWSLLLNPPSTPVQVPGLKHVVAIAAGTNVVVLKDDGTVWDWGNNYIGELGDGTTTSSQTPVEVSGLTNVVAISAGMWDGAALKSDGSVWTWGDNDWGELGDGTFSRRLVPVQVVGIGGATAVSASYEDTAALLADGTVWDWGDNGREQLGVGFVPSQSSFPLRVPGFGPSDPPSPNGMVAINGGAAYVTTPNVLLTLWAATSTGTVTDVRFSNDGVNWSDWQAYATSASWTLATGTNMTTVCAQFRDSGGNVSASTSATTNLAPFTSTLTINDGASYTISQFVKLSLG